MFFCRRGNRVCGRDEGAVKTDEVCGRPLDPFGFGSYLLLGFYRSFFILVYHFVGREFLHDRIPWRFVSACVSRSGVHMRAIPAAAEVAAHARVARCQLGAAADDVAAGADCVRGGFHMDGAFAGADSAGRADGGVLLFARPFAGEKVGCAGKAAGRANADGRASADAPFRLPAIHALPARRE